MINKPFEKNFGMKSRALSTLAGAFTAICILPALGLVTAGLPLERYLEFPPATLYIAQAPFDWLIFAALAVFLALCAAVLVRDLLQSFKPARAAFPFPRWGYAGAALLSISWLVAWSREPIFSAVQPHTFFPLWLGYILVVNALCFCWKGDCPLFKKTAYSALFILSSAFWWSFEYLNRFVQNWSYENVSQFPPLEYFLYATLSFSMVLPAVWATKEWLNAVGIAKASPDEPVFSTENTFIHYTLLAAGLLGLLLLPFFPRQLYPLVWLTPIFMMLSFARISGLEIRISRSDVLGWSTAGLMCGFFWELWNYHSYARWVYHVSYVEWGHLFEMPILGYGGYLPFGLFCGLVVQIFLCLFED